MQVGDYQISNLLIGAVLFTTVAGLGIATGAAGSVADVVSDTFIPGGNATQAPDTDSDSSETDQNTDTTDSQDTDDGGGSPDSTDSTDSSGSSDSGGSSDSDSSSTDSTSTQDSETGDQQDNQQQDNQQQDNQQDDGNIQTSASITSPSNGQIYNTASVDIAATVEAANASYEVRLDDSLKQSGQLDGTKDISSTLSISDGAHNIKVLVKRSGETLVSKKAQFSVSTSSTNTSGSASISLFDPSSQTYSTNTVPLLVTLDASDASYQVNVDRVTKTSGSVDGSKTLDQDLNIVSGSHNLEVVINDSTGTLASDSVSFTVDTGDTGTQRTGFYSPDNLTVGGTALVILYNDQGDPVEDTTVTVGSLGDFTTDQFGEIEFQVPFQDTITASSTNYEKTFDIIQTASEPDITLTQPTDPTIFETPTGTSRDVTFEADVDITEGSGTASLIVDGSQAYTQDLSSGTNSISTTQALSGGTHNWQVDVDTPEYDVSSSSRSLTVNEVEVQNGLSLQNNATAGEFNYVRLYDNGEPVQGTEITVNGDSIGTTDSNGEVGFEVPNVQEITVSASGYSDITRTVEGYEEANTPLVYSASIQNSGPGELQTPFELSATVDTGLADSYEIIEQGTTLRTGSLEENSSNSISHTLDLEAGDHQIILKAVNNENGEEKKAASTKFTVASDPVTFVNPQSGHHLDSSDSIEIDIEDSSGENYQVLLDGTQIDHGVVDSDILHLDYNRNFFQENHGLQVNIGSDSYSADFTSETYSQPTLNLVKPGTVNGFNAYSNFTVQSELDYNYEVLLDGETIESDSSSYQNSEHNVLIRGLTQGDHTMQVLINPVQSHQNFTTEEISFETTEEPPLGEIEWGPIISSGDVQQSGNVLMSYEAYVYEQSSFEFIINGTVEDERVLTKGDHQPLIEKNLEAGYYELQLNISDYDSNEEIVAGNQNLRLKENVG